MKSIKTKQLYSIVAYVLILSTATVLTYEFTFSGKELKYDEFYRLVQSGAIRDVASKKGLFSSFENKVVVFTTVNGSPRHVVVPKGQPAYINHAIDDALPDLYIFVLKICFVALALLVAFDLHFKKKSPAAQI